MIPTLIVRALVEDWLSGYGDPEAGYRAMATHSGLGADTWRKRFSEGAYESTSRNGNLSTTLGWWARDEIDPGDVDDLLVAMDATHLWYLPPLYGLEVDWASAKASSLPAKRKRRRRHFIPPENIWRGPGVKKELSDAELLAVVRLHEAGLSIRAIARRTYAAWGYTSETGCRNRILRKMRAAGLKPRDRVAATVLALTTHGHRNDPAYRRARRRALGLLQPKCSAAKYGAYAEWAGTVGQPCTRYAMKGSVYCASHRGLEADGRAA